MRQSMFSTCIQRRNYTCWEDKRPPLDRSNGQTNGRRSQGSKHHEATPETLEPTRPDLQLTTEDPYIRLAYPNIGNTLLVYCASTGATECCQNTSSYHYDSNFGNCALRVFCSVPQGATQYQVSTAPTQNREQIPSPCRQAACASRPGPPLAAQRCRLSSMPCPGGARGSTPQRAGSPSGTSGNSSVRRPSPSTARGTPHGTHGSTAEP